MFTRVINSDLYKKETILIKIFISHVVFDVLFSDSMYFVSFYGLYQFRPWLLKNYQSLSAQAYDFNGRDAPVRYIDSKRNDY